MSTFMSKDRFEDLQGGYHELQQAINSLAECYVNEFGGRHATITSIAFGWDIDFDFDDSSIRVETETYHCNCCGPDGNYYNIPISYLWEEGWIEAEHEKRAASERDRLDRLRKEEEERQAKLAAARKAQYEQLKKEFENAVD